MDGNHQPVRSRRPSPPMVGTMMSVAFCLAMIWTSGQRGDDHFAALESLDANQLKQASRSRATAIDWQRLMQASYALVDEPAASPLLVAEEFAATPDLILPTVEKSCQLAQSSFVSRPTIDGHRATTSRALSQCLQSIVRPATRESQRLFAQALDLWPQLSGATVAQRVPPSPRRIRVDAGDRIAMRGALPSLPEPQFGPTASNVYELFDSIPLTLNTPFARATQLEAVLHDLSLEPSVTLWSRDALRTLDQLTDANEFQQHASHELLTRLVVLADEAGRTAEAVVDETLAVRLRQARWGLLRRGGCWSAVDAVCRTEPRIVASAGGERRAIDVGAAPIRFVTHSVESNDAAPLPDDWSSLTSTIERYEQSGEPRLAQAIADHSRMAAMSPNPRERALANQLEVHYRNANLRLAVSRDLLLRMIEPQSTRDEEVHDIIVGTPVHGTAKTTSHLHVELLEDLSAWRVGLQLTGETNSRTQSYSPPVTIESIGTTRFAGSKQLLVDRSGPHTGATRTVAEASNQLVGIRSKYDGVPLAGRLIESRAQDEYAKRKSQAEREVEQKASLRVSNEFDARIDQAINDAKLRYQQQIADRLDRFGMKLDTLQLETNSERMIGRFRVARPDQLAAHTPRPRALADSLASLQLHESLVTNLAAGLDLDGQRMTVNELREHLAAKFPGQTVAESDIDGDATLVQFADTGAVVVKFVEGQARLQLSIVELLHERSRHRNFRIHVYFEPAVDGLSARLVHASGPHIEGQLRNAERFRLQAILGSVFGDETEIVVVPASDDPRFAGLTITQLVIDDGWLGWSIGPMQLGRATVFERR